MQICIRYLCDCQQFQLTAKSHHTEQKTGASCRCGTTNADYGNVWGRRFTCLSNEEEKDHKESQKDNPRLSFQLRL